MTDDNTWPDDNTWQLMTQEEAKGDEKDLGQERPQPVPGQKEGRKTIF